MNINGNNALVYAGGYTKYPDEVHQAAGYSFYFSGKHINVIAAPCERMYLPPQRAANLEKGQT